MAPRFYSFMLITFSAASLLSSAQAVMCLRASSQHEARTPEFLADSSLQTWEGFLCYLGECDWFEVRMREECGLARPTESLGSHIARMRKMYSSCS